MKRTVEEAKRTRKLLLDTALLSFAEDGWEGVTFVGIAAKAGLSRGAIHHHFQSKEELLQEVLVQGWERYGEVLTQADNHTDPVEWLSELIGDFISLIRDDPQFRALISTTVLVAPQSSLDYDLKLRAMDRWRDKIVQTLANTRTTMLPLTIANLTVVLLQGLTLTAVACPQNLPSVAEHDVVVATLVKTLLS